MFKISLYIVFVACVSLSLFKSYQTIAEESVRYQQQSHCITEYLIKGYSRSEISTSNGTCAIASN